MTPAYTHRCVACLTAFQPRVPHHRLCRHCYRWHAFGIAIERFVPTQPRPAEVVQ